MKLAKARCGFTLMEVLIAAAILAVVMATVAAAFRTGLFGYRNIRSAINTYQAARQILEGVDTDLKNAVVWSPEDSGFSGTATEISFHGLANTYAGGGFRKDYALIGYTWDGTKLYRLCRTGRESLNADSQLNPREIVAAIEDFSFRYAAIDPELKSLVFFEAWDNPEQLPAAVKISVSLGGNQFERLSFLPLAKSQ
jgi:prepilin-type N-terminal cleavage/methylation domain-containing protein